MEQTFESVDEYKAYTMEQAAKREAMLNALPDALATSDDAIADLSLMVSDNVTDIADVMDAIAELSEIVSNLMEV